MFYYILCMYVCMYIYIYIYIYASPFEACGRLTEPRKSRRVKSPCEILGEIIVKPPCEMLAGACPNLVANTGRDLRPYAQSAY